MKRGLTVCAALALMLTFGAQRSFAQDHAHDHDGHSHAGHGHEGHNHGDEGHDEKAHAEHEHGEATDDHAMQAPSPEQMKEMMDQWLKLMQPSTGHKRLNYFVGKWNIKTQMWWGGPGTPPMESTGTTEVKWIMGGRYLQEDVKSHLVMPGPNGEMTQMPFEGMSLTGYDNFRKMYTHHWIDSMSTASMIGKGSCDPAGKVWTFYGEMDEPQLAIGRMVKSIIRIVDQDKYVFEMYDLHVSDDYKVMEITYTRQK